jgi:catechol 2,3-dioxygenase-like lactoylglutathione lyase family enzyme
MRIALTSVLVNDQARAHAFYTDVLGFVTKEDVPVGDARWLTVVSPEGSPDVELLLEPTGHPASKVYQKALFDDGVPLTAFATPDVQREYERLTALGVAFRSPPTPAGPTVVAAFDDTCGNLIQLYQA